jgi:hypothetical protein
MSYPHLAKKVVKALVTFYNGISSGSLTLIGAWPTNGSKLQIVASSVTGHTDCTGRVTINGTENIDFVAAAKKISTTALTTRPTITTSNLDCNMVITCLDPGSQPIYTSTETDLPCRIYLKRKYLPAPQGGFTQIQETLLECRDLTIIPGTTIKFDITNRKVPTAGIEYTVSAIDPVDGPGGTEHKRMIRF